MWNVHRQNNEREICCKTPRGAERGGERLASSSRLWMWGEGCMGIHDTILQTFTFESLQFPITQSQEDTGPHSRRHTFVSLGSGPSPGVFLRFPGVLLHSPGWECCGRSHGTRRGAAPRPRRGLRRGRNWSGTGQGAKHMVRNGAGTG